MQIDGEFHATISDRLEQVTDEINGLKKEAELLRALLSLEIERNNSHPNNAKPVENDLAPAASTSSTRDLLPSEVLSKVAPEAKPSLTQIPQSPDATNPLVTLTYDPGISVTENIEVFGRRGVFAQPATAGVIRDVLLERGWETTAQQPLNAVTSALSRLTALAEQNKSLIQVRVESGKKMYFWPQEARAMP